MNCADTSPRRRASSGRSGAGVRLMTALRRRNAAESARRRWRKRPAARRRAPAKNVGQIVVERLGQRAFGRRKAAEQQHQRPQQQRPRQRWSSLLSTTAPLLRDAWALCWCGCAPLAFILLAERVQNPSGARSKRAHGFFAPPSGGNRARHQTVSAPRRPASSWSPACRRD